MRWWLKTITLYLAAGVCALLLSILALGAAMWAGGGEQAALLVTRRGWAMVTLVAVKSFGLKLCVGVGVHFVVMFTAYLTRPALSGARLGAGAGALLGLTLALSVDLRAWQLALLLLTTYGLLGAAIGWRFGTHRR
jgi:hypothetical protein